MFLLLVLLIYYGNTIIKYNIIDSNQNIIIKIIIFSVSPPTTQVLLYIGTYKQKTYGIYKNESQNIIHSNYIQKNNSLATGYITIHFNKKTEPLIRTIYF